MLYVEDADGQLWLHVVGVLGERETYEMVLGCYSDSTGAVPEPFCAAADAPLVERVIEHPAGTEPVQSAPLRVSAALLDVLARDADEFEEWGESMAIYAPRQWEWAAAFIPERRVIVVRDPQLYGFLDSAGVAVSREAPERWDGAEEA